MKNTDKELFRNILKALEPSESGITIIPHSNPDGDAIGSAIGLGNILVNRGHLVSIVSPNDYPTYYNWFENKPEIIFFDKQKSKAKEIIEKSKVVICVDFNDLSRVGKLKDVVENFDGTTILIDHHPDPVNFCDHMVSDITYSSTAELVYDLVIALGLHEFIDKSVAESLFCGIMTDTGSFRHNISDPNTFMVVSELLKFGINADYIHDSVYNNFSADRMKLLGYILNEKMEVFPEFKTAVISITKNELKKFNFVPGDTEGFVNYPLSISGIVFSVLFIEKEGYVKASFRSKGKFPANSFSASHFNGGGHLNAAGGEIELNMEETLSRFKQLLPDYLHQLLNADS